MQQLFGQYLNELLYKHDRLSIPGLGSLEARHASSVLDQIQGRINAPSKEIKFNEHLILDDGLLVNYLIQNKGLSSQQAQDWIKEQVDGMKKSLQKREIIELPGLGRFFNNFENQLQFVAENHNYNTTSFGLQSVLAQAVNHSIADRTTLTTAPVSNTINKNIVKKEKDNWLSKNFWWMIIAGIVLLSLFAFMIFLQKKSTKNTTIAEADKVPKERLNTSPTKAEKQNTIAPPPTEQQPMEPVIENEDPIEPSETTTMLGNEHTAIIAVGLFGDPQNVQGLLEELTIDGFSPVTETENNNTRVGVSIRFEEEKELQKILRELRKNYTSSAFVMYRDGQRVK